MTPCARALCIALLLLTAADATRMRALAEPGSVATLAKAASVATLAKTAPFEAREAREPRNPPEEARLHELRNPSNLPSPDAVRGLSPTWFWFSASATIITASLAGFYALRVRDLYDQARDTPDVSPLRLSLHERMRTAELTADLLFAGTLVLAVGTTVLAWHIDWSSRRSRAREPRARLSRWSLAPVVTPEHQALLLRGSLP